jgi:hypothetical protein
MDNQNNQKELWRTTSAFSGKNIERKQDNINQDDSSDEEEENEQNKNYNLIEVVGSEKFKEFVGDVAKNCVWINKDSFIWHQRCNIRKIMEEKQINEDEALKILSKLNENEELGEKRFSPYKICTYINRRIENEEDPDSGLVISYLQIEQSEIIKSFLLHNFGRMYIYSPKIDKLYRNNKRFLSTNSKKKRRFFYEELLKDRQYHATKRIKPSQNEEFTVNNLQQLLILGRILRRSQIRRHREILDFCKESNKGQEHLVEIHTNFSLHSKDNNSIVKETLVMSEKGLGRPRNFPSCDMVHLPFNKGDYTSAYKSIQCLPANFNILRMTNVSQKLGPNKEIQEETKEKLKIFENLINDESIKKLLENNLFSQKISDQIIAELMNDACRGKDLKLKEISKEAQEKIYALTYLLFKTEVYRSPAALINNMQMLELIEYGKLSFEEAFVEQLMPMSMQGAIKAGRSLNYQYNKKDISFYYYNNPYVYSGEETRDDKKIKVNLIKKESGLMDKWLRMKLEQSEERYSEDDIKSILENPTESNNLKIICEEINKLGIRFDLPSLEPLQRISSAMDTDEEEEIYTQEKVKEPQNNGRNMF